MRLIPVLVEAIRPHLAPDPAHPEAQRQLARRHRPPEGLDERVWLAATGDDLSTAPS
jgi:hypothetical protein